MILAGFSKISISTTDIKKAMEFSDICIMICPSFAQELLFNDMLPYIRDDMRIIIMPGNYGVLVINRILKEKFPDTMNNISFIDSITIPWACRIVSPGVITIMGLKEFLPLSIFT
ncbi:hypothetical protein, partial [Brachyspira sp.]|uniref:hypothetical protein n=1 Tax=Brachyspira sp. TaxID=1977261 RepID=UPI00260EA28B